MDSILEQYKNWLTVNGRSKSTTINYLLRIQKILKNISIDNLSEDTISSYLLNIKDKYKPSTVNGYRDTLDSFIKFLKKDIKLPEHLKIPQILPKYIDEKDFLKNIIPEIDNVFRNKLKIKTLFYFMYYTGIRVSEIDYLKRDNFNFENRTVKIFIPKTNEERIVIYTELVRDFLKVYFGSEPERLNAFNLRSSTVKTVFARLKKRMNIDLHPHSFRHGYATMCLKKGINLAIISKLLGHKSITTTMRYLGLDVETLIKAYNQNIK